MNRFIIASVALAASQCMMAVDPSGTLPVLHIDTENHQTITSKENYLMGTYYLDPRGAEGIEAIGSAAEPAVLQIRGRGNYTWTGFDKKPYRLKLDKKAALMGTKKSKHYALLAHADDREGFMRNILGLALSRRFGLAWTPADKPVEVVLNGEYIGLYFLTETIRVDEDRVNIVEQADNITDPEAITGGWLLEIDNYDSDPHVRIHENGDNDIIFTYKTPEVLSAQQEAWLRDEMTDINAKIYASDKDNCAWAEKVDLDALARYFLVQEIMDDHESFHGSCYMHRELGADSKWIFGPVWDFGSSNITTTKTQTIAEDRMWHQTWIGEMVKFPAFIDKVKEVWTDFYTSGAINDVIDYVSATAERIDRAAKTDKQRWPEYGNDDVKEKSEVINRNLRNRMLWINNLYGQSLPGKVITVYFEDNNPSPWDNVKAYSWCSAGTPFGEWPGTDCKRIDNFNQYPTWSYSYDMSLLPDDVGEIGLIFNNGHSGEGNQTDNFVLIPDGVYRMEGYYGSGVEDVATETSDAEAEYYTLQGIRVANPGTGLYIRRQGSSVTKVLLQ